ncbi:MAG: DUF2513 domain-containing protein [Pseudorhodobacter sp.]|nr:DUF2513 domain-containing protein [Pseudorhodobacter sp.]
MKRDDDYIRDLLLKYEGEEDWLLFMPGETLGSGEDEWKERYHALLLMDQGLLATVGKGTMRLTSQGHDFLEAVRDEGIWSRTKDAVRDTGGSATLEIVKALATGFLKKKISQYTGIEL